MTKWLSLALVLFFLGCHSKSDWAEIFLKKGEVYLRKGKYGKSLEELLKAQRLAPSDQRVYENMAQVHFKLKNYGPATESLNKIVEINPDCAASIYFMRGELVASNPVHAREAIRLSYTPAIERDPSQGLYFYKRGLAYMLLGEMKSAQADFLAAKQLGFKEEQAG